DPPLPDEIDPEAALDDAEDYWHDWANTCSHHGDYHDEIHESLLVLKALTFAPTGGIVAAPTTSLPEHIGGVRNWDYRFCWLRDASGMVRTMVALGFHDEADAFLSWILYTTWLTRPNLQVLYSVYGHTSIREKVIDWLSVHCNS